MTSDVVIKVAELGKRYRIGLAQKRSENLGQAVMKAVASPFRYLSTRLTRASEEEILWALRDISFEVRQGEVLGIIGRNGAGKSTLLKILSKITDPSRGYAEIHGRVNSLLEVGTGFHPELTGRENIYLSAAIHGMRRSEVNRNLDEIVEFAGVRKFIDTPVKRYSSGMQVRLGFAVAAHLEPEILIVDEVLAVGDVAFKRKSLGKMNAVAGEGRTVILVSHQMEAISNMCTRCILLEGGEVVAQGQPDDMIEKYLALNAEQAALPLHERTDRAGDGRVRVVDSWLVGQGGRRTGSVRMGKPLTFAVLYEAKKGVSVRDLEVAVAVNTVRNVEVTDLSNVISGCHFDGTLPEQGCVTCTVPDHPLNRGTYTYNIELRLSSFCLEDHVIKAGSFDVEADDFFGTGKIPNTNRLIMVNQNWSIAPWTGERAP